MKRDIEFTHFIAIDFGTYGCGMAVSTNVDPDNSPCLLELAPEQDGCKVPDCFTATER